MVVCGGKKAKKRTGVPSFDELPASHTLGEALSTLIDAAAAEEMSPQKFHLAFKFIGPRPMAFVEYSWNENDRSFEEFGKYVLKSKTKRPNEDADLERTTSFTGENNLSCRRHCWRISMTNPCTVHANDNIHPDHPLRLEDAIKYGFPYGGMTVSGLRREAARGRLIIERIANKDFTSLRNIEEMRKLCRVEVEGRDSGGEKSAEKAARLSRGEHGLLSTVASITPQAALLAKIEKRKNS